VLRHELEVLRRKPTGRDCVPVSSNRDNIHCSGRCEVNRRGVSYDVGRVLGLNWRPDFDPTVVHRELEIIKNDLHCNAVEKGQNWTNSPKKVADQERGSEGRSAASGAARRFGRTGARAVERWPWEVQVRHGSAHDRERARDGDETSILWVPRTPSTLLRRRSDTRG
jgi:hypothetical protein